MSMWDQYNEAPFCTIPSSMSAFFDLLQREPVLVYLEMKRLYKKSGIAFHFPPYSEFDLPREFDAYDYEQGRQLPFEKTACAIREQIYAKSRRPGLDLKFQPIHNNFSNFKFVYTAFRVLCSVELSFRFFINTRGIPIFAAGVNYNNSDFDRYRNA